MDNYRPVYNRGKTMWFDRCRFVLVSSKMSRLSMSGMVVRILREWNYPNWWKYFECYHRHRNKFVKHVCLPAKQKLKKKRFILIPPSVGRILLHVVTVTCISLSTLPINTSFLYSWTNTAITVTSRLVGVIQISPVSGLKLTAGLDDNGEVAEMAVGK